jgi:hypothetical protein
MRASIIAERLWNNNISIKTSQVNIATRLTTNTIRMRHRGFKVAPVADGLCEKNASYCYK